MSEDTYLYRVREGVPGKPIFFVFHGTGGDENQFLDFAARLLPEATIVAPRGDVSEHGAARYFRRTGEGVYDMADLARATGKMAAFVKEQRDRKGASKVLGLGFSNGANILANVMIEHGSLFDAGMLLHPLIPFQPGDNAELAGRRILITAGERDPICPAPMTRSLADYFTRQNAEVTLEWHPGGHELRQNEIDAVQALVGNYL
ncbi:alpha/beta hydrolase [Rhizobiaceae bacterium n13]|uniref:Alpha/beta hydrolase n=1 Tax=Ferirhizobium litorale TaxID=2927786 RepID=A0AAE3U2A1_9HYPH|nr:alpha/beta hydrolase [Fererhizobium litorale]MDI7860626.1 alpha/beta hydrolase [Fererhizobium litorale]MDI7920774.1 alpha/beta hydrolase [Fererhizobium litorale]